MADDSKRPNQRATGGAEVVRRRAAPQTTGEIMRRSGTVATGVAAEAGEAAGQVAARGDAAMETAARRGQELVADAVRQTVEAARGVAEAGAEVARRGERAEAGLVHGTAEVARQGSGAAAEGGGQWMDAAHGPAGMWRMMVPGAGLPGGVLEMQKTLSDLLGDMVRANMQVGQELFRLMNPLALIEMQQRAVQGYLDLVVSGQAALLRTAQQAGGEALRSAEKELEQRA